MKVLAYPRTSTLMTVEALEPKGHGIVVTLCTMAFKSATPQHTSRIQVLGIVRFHFHFRL